MSVFRLFGADARTDGTSNQCVELSGSVIAMGKGTAAIQNWLFLLFVVSGQHRHHGYANAFVRHQGTPHISPRLSPSVEVRKSLQPRFQPLCASVDGEESATDGDRNRGILVLMTVPLAWGTFEPVVRYVYAIEPPIPGLVFAPCYYLVAATALSLLSLVDDFSSDPPEHRNRDGQCLKTRENTNVTKR